MARLAHSDVVIIPAVDRPSRDTTDLLVIAREMRRAGAGIRSLAEPFLDTTSDFAEFVFAILGASRRSWNIAASRNAPHGAAPTPRPRASNSAQAETHPAPAARGNQASRRGQGNAALDRSQLQCQSADDFTVDEHRGPANAADLRAG